MLPKLAVIGLIVTYIILSATASYVTRLRGGPDETAHMIYVREIGERFCMPGVSKVETNELFLSSSHEAHQPPLYYVAAAAPYRLSRALGADSDTSWHVVRLFTVLIGALWLYFLYRLSGEFLNKRPYAAILAAACVGLLPLSVYLGGIVNNDAAIALFFTASLWLIARAVRVGDITRKAAVQIGIVSGLAILSKSQGLFLIPFIGITALVLAKRNGWKKSKSLIKCSLISIAIALLVSSLWFVRNWFVYGTPILQTLYNPAVPPGSSLGVVGWLLATRDVTRELFNFFWTPFWLLIGQVDAVAYERFLEAFCFLVAIGVFIRLRACKHMKVTDLCCRADAWGLFLIPGALIYLFLFRHTLLVDQGTLQQGRLLLPAAAPFGVAVIIGLGELMERPLNGLIAARVSARLRDGIRKLVAPSLGLLLLAGLMVANIAVLRAIVIYYQYH